MTRHTRRQWRKPGEIPARSRHCDRPPGSVSQELPPSPPATSGRGHPGRGRVLTVRRLRMTYPFSAVVGMDDLRLALLLNAVSPAIGGVLVRGEKGTAKSTAVRALAALLPPVDVVAGCRFACDPAAPDPACPDGPHDAGAPAARPPGPPGRAAGRRLRGPGRRLAGPRAGARPRASRPSSRACSPPPTAACSTSTRSTCCTTTWSTCCSTPPRWAAPTSSARASRSGTRPGSCWSAR